MAAGRWFFRWEISSVRTVPGTIFLASDLLTSRTSTYFRRPSSLRGWASSRLPGLNMIFTPRDLAFVKKASRVSKSPRRVVT